MELDHIGNPESPIRFIGTIRTGIMGPTIDDRAPNEGLAQIETP